MWSTWHPHALLIDSEMGLGVWNQLYGVIFLSFPPSVISPVPWGSLFCWPKNWGFIYPVLLCTSHDYICSPDLAVGGHRGKVSNWDLPHSLRVTLLVGKEGSSLTALGICRSSCFPIPWAWTRVLFLELCLCCCWLPVFVLLYAHAEWYQRKENGKCMVYHWFGEILNSSLLPQSIYYCLPFLIPHIGAPWILPWLYRCIL